MSDTTPTECWIIVDQEDRFFRRRLSSQPSCYVTIFSTQALAISYIELIQPGLKGARLEAKHYTWDGIIERFSPWMTHALLDHEYDSNEGVAIPISQKEEVSK